MTTVIRAIGAPLLRLAALRPGEGRRTALSAVYLFLVVGTFIALKAVRDSLFLDTFGAPRLPYAILGVALGASLFAALYIRIARRVSMIPLISWSLVLFGALLVAFRWIAVAPRPWIYPVFYVWTGVYGVVAPAQAWTLINDLFTTRQAKRAFGVIGAGGILGGLWGGWLVSGLSAWIGTLDVLLVLAAVLFVAAGLVRALASHRLPDVPQAHGFTAPRHLPDTVRTITRSRHLRLITALVLLSALATAFADFQFQALAAERLSGDALTAFFGGFYGTVGGLALLIQVLLSGRLLRWIGLGGTILLMPLLMTGATLLLLPTLGLWAAGLVKASDSMLKHSIDRSSRELAFLPVHRSIKVHVKSTIDMAFDRLGDGLAGLLLIGFAAAGLLSVRGVALANLLVLGTWVVVGIALGRSYVGELGQSIAEGRVEARSWNEALGGQETIQALRVALRGSERQALAALALVAENPDWGLRDELRRLARDGTPELRARALAILLDPAEERLDEGIDAAFGSEDQELLTECIDLIVAAPSDRERFIESILSRAAGHSRGVWIALMLRRLGPEFLPFGRALLERLLDPAAPASAREAAASAIGHLPAGLAPADLLPPLFQDGSRAVVLAAIRSAGAVGTPALLAELVPLLGRPGIAEAVRNALAAHGDAALPLLVDALSGEFAPGVRARIPGVLERIGSPRAATALVAALGHTDRATAAAAADALVRRRVGGSDWRVLDPRQVHAMAYEEAVVCFERTEQLVTLRDPGAPGDEVRLLAAALDETLVRQRARLFRVLALAYPPRQMALCHEGLVSGDPERRSNALELLEHLEPRPAWRRLVPLLDPDAAAVPRGPRDPAVAIFGLCRDRSPWLRRCALSAAVAIDPPRAIPLLRAAMSDADPEVRQEAGTLLTRTEALMSTPAEFTLVDKVLALRRVSLFRDVPPEQVSRLATVARNVVLPAGRELSHQDGAPGDLYVVLDGEVEVERDGDAIALCGPGEAIGAWSLLADEPPPITARTTRETAALRIDRLSFEDAWSESPALSRSVLAQLLRKLPPNVV